ncbi:glycoside hydrolase family 13 protein [Amanita muscaria Koide BX008]|uniref:Glycoside hydrolase family 13 protein n=1 Tax=Amanita muscaria (strain Koide BX008) TaxID=946122 RepID=A0A0C2X0I1_AMAMK|nr:glycoside hydrolase family 13 protein [Amanita muscaria Koide BX008]
MFSWTTKLFRPSPSALPQMRLGPDDHTDNALMLQFFTWDALHKDMSWWKHLNSELPRLAQMGFTQVWIPPANKASEPSGRGYDAYDLWDLGEFDQKGAVRTRWGTKEELLQACKTAQQLGIDILVDAVLNHKMGADRTEVVRAVPVDPQNRLKEIGRPRDIETWTAFDFKGRGDKYNTFRWNQEHFNGIDWDERTQTRDIYRFAGPGHKGWSNHVDRERGNFDYLLGANIDYRHPAVQQDMLDWGCWILQTTGGSGFRLDAIKHIDRRFVLNFVQHVRQQTGNSNLFAVAEYWSDNLKTILPIIQMFKGATAFFDVPLHMNFHNASRRGSKYNLTQILKATIVSVKPKDAVTFVDNHECVEGQSLESWVGNQFKIQAYALILLRGEGHPCVFYGDLYPNPECYNERISRNLTLLIEARKKFAYGPTVDYFRYKNCIGFVRLGDDAHPGCAVVLSNKEDGSGTVVHTLRMNVGKRHAVSTFATFLQDDGKVNIDSNGWGEFTSIANHAQVWVRVD